MTKIGIIGNGFVGNAIHQGMMSHYKVLVYDINPSRTLNSLDEINKVDVVFVCVPTPTDQSGKIDISLIKDAIKSLDAGKTIIIKSTITPDAARELNENFRNQNIVYNPEFLSERTAVEDFQNPTRIILGGNPQRVEEIYKLYLKVFPEVEYIKTDFKTACFIKYLCNCFYATEISILNEFKQVADKEEVDWETAIRGLLSSGWVNSMHTNVPGPDGKHGFGGKCFPKDINAFIDFSLTTGVKPIILKAAWEKNLEVREEQDWLKIEGAVTTKGNKNE